MDSGKFTRSRLLTCLMALVGIALVWLAMSGAALADDTPPACGGKILEKCTPNSGDTAWMLTSVALVLMMTIPGLGLFYGGMVRKKNVLATLAQSFGATCIITVLWMIVGYSVAFTPNANPQLNQFIGSFDQFMLGKMGLNAVNPLAATIPESVYMFFQMTFAIITPALIAGAHLQRDAAKMRNGIERVYAYFPMLKSRRAQLSGYLSGGEQQMLVIGRALMSRPKMILLDEPSMGLAPQIVAEVMATIRKLKESGLSIVLVEQSPKLVFDIADDIVILNSGRVAVVSTAAELKARDVDLRQHLGVF